MLEKDKGTRWRRPVECCLCDEPDCPAIPCAWRGKPFAALPSPGAGTNPTAAAGADAARRRGARRWNGAWGFKASLLREYEEGSSRMLALTGAAGKFAWVPESPTSPGRDTEKAPEAATASGAHSKRRRNRCLSMASARFQACISSFSSSCRQCFTTSRKMSDSVIMPTRWPSLSTTGSPLTL